MNFDWVTLVAQIVNFLLLMGLLWYFLFRPVIRAVDRREEEIAGRIDEADQKKKDAEEERQQLQEQRQELEDNRQQYLAEAKEEAEKKRKELVNQAREEVEEARQRWRNSLQREKDSFLQDLRRRASHQVFQSVRKVLRDLADADVEARMVQAFIDRLGHLPEERQQEIHDGLAQTDDGFVVRSAFEIPDEKQNTIRERLNQLVNEERRVEFETSDQIIAGIEAQAGGQKVAWTMTNYLEGLEQDVQEALETQTQRGQHTRNASLPRVDIDQGEGADTGETDSESPTAATGTSSESS